MQEEGNAEGEVFKTSTDEFGDFWFRQVEGKKYHLWFEADGYVTRKAYAEVPPRVEYELTERGRTLTPLLDNLVQWAADHLAEIVNDRRRFLEQ